MSFPDGFMSDKHHLQAASTSAFIFLSAHDILYILFKNHIYTVPGFNITWLFIVQHLHLCTRKDAQSFIKQILMLVILLFSMTSLIIVRTTHYSNRALGYSDYFLFISVSHFPFDVSMLLRYLKRCLFVHLCYL